MRRVKFVRNNIREIRNKVERDENIGIKYSPTDRVGGLSKAALVGGTEEGLKTMCRNRDMRSH